MKPKAPPLRRKKGSHPVAQRKNPTPAGAAFPIVGIGASAGGLEALEQFLGHVPAGSGMAFVIIQHLDPTHKGIMPALLQRATGMRWSRSRIAPRCDGLRLCDPPEQGYVHLAWNSAPADPAAPGDSPAIDFFLRSLALDQQEHSIGVFFPGWVPMARWGCGPSRRRPRGVVQDPHGQV